MCCAVGPCYLRNGLSRQLLNASSDRGPGAREPCRKGVAVVRRRSFAREQIMPLAGSETKNRPFMQWLAAQTAGLMLPCRVPERLQRTFQILWRGFALRPGSDPQAAISQRGYDYFFFFEVFFATFLV